MTVDREKLALEAKLETCRQLSHDFPDGPTAANLHEIERELRQKLHELASRSPRLA